MICWKLCLNKILSNTFGQSIWQETWHQGQRNPTQSIGFGLWIQLVNRVMYVSYVSWLCLKTRSPKIYLFPAKVPEDFGSLHLRHCWIAYTAVWNEDVCSSSILSEEKDHICIAIIAGFCNHVFFGPFMCLRTCTIWQYLPGLWLYNLNQNKQHQPLSPNHVLFQEVNSTCFIRGSSDPYYGFTLFQRIQKIIF